jgi:hypothetical protein
MPIHLYEGVLLSPSPDQEGNKLVTKLRIYSTYSPQNSIPFLAHCTNFCKPLEKMSESFLSNQVSPAAMTTVLDEKW